MRLNKIILFLIITILLFSCNSENEKKNIALKLIDRYYEKLQIGLNVQGNKLNNQCNCIKIHLLNDLQNKYTAKELNNLKKDSRAGVEELMKLISNHNQEINDCLSEMSSEREINFEVFEKKYGKTFGSAKEENQESVVNKNREKTIIKMNKRNGVYEIPAEINGLTMYFIFDTGASIISISETEAHYLYKQGRFDNSDILGSQQFIDANGDISEGTVINLKTVKIGEVLLNNIKASVVHNQEAPLLFGQSALEEFGKISIDYKRGEITFE